MAAVASALATLLAGCTAPQGPLETPGAPPAMAHPILGSASSLPSLRGDEGATCPLPSPPREEQRPGYLLLQAWGCVRAATPSHGLDRRLGSPVAEFEVPEEAQRLKAFLHLHGPEAMEAVLLGPGEATWGKEAQGSWDIDSFALFEVQDPRPGRWRLEADVLELAVMRGWSATFEASWTP